MTNAMLAMLLALQLITLPMAVREMATRESVDPALAACIIQAESQWDTNHLGAAGEIGLMQILPSTGEWAASKIGLTNYDLWQPVTNIEVGLWILKGYPEFYHTMYLCE